MIPKKLHYVWVGKQPIPVKYQAFIDNWARIMPDWEVLRHDESNFDVNCAEYCSEAYQQKRWAFVSDYIRVKVLYEEGGVYLDTDEEMVKPIECFARNKFFVGMEPGYRIGGQVFGCEVKSEIMRAILEYYNSIQYIGNTVIGTHFYKVLRSRYNFELKEEVQELERGVVIYPSQFFCPDLATLKIDENSYTIHRPMASWLSPMAQLKKKLYIFITKVKPLKWLYCKIKR